MKRERRLVFACALLVGLVTPHLAGGQDQQCAVRIATPKDGGSVSGNGLASGTASIPPGRYLWVLAHREGLALWWPEGGGSATVTGGNWKAVVTYGVGHDSSYRFEVATAVVDQDTNSRLMNWVREAEKTGQYPGIEWPRTVDGCAIQKITVTREK
jgi:hypothetical protein